MQSKIKALDLFAGAGGWDLAAADLGIHADGVEIMPEALATRNAAGLRTVHHDVWTFPLGLLAQYEMLIASPPCQTFSAAGNGSGRKALNDVLSLVKTVESISLDGLQECGRILGDDRTALVLTPLWYALHMPRVTSTAWEQVPAVLPAWEACAEVLRAQGWNVWTGLVYAEQYGVPQTRKRAVLIASLDHEVDRPAATHSRWHIRNKKRLDEGVLPWVSMAQALGWSEDDVAVSNYGTGGDASKRGQRTGAEPSATVTSKVDQNKVLRSPQSVAGVGRAERDQSEPSVTVTGNFSRAKWEERSKPTHMGDVVRKKGCVRSVDEPAPTIIGAMDNGNHRWVTPPQPSGLTGDTVEDLQWVDSPKPTSARVSIAEAGVLQSFPADFPWQGSLGKQYLQAGNAVPPLLARAVLSTLV